MSQGLGRRISIIILTLCCFFVNTGAKCQISDSLYESIEVVLNEYGLKKGSFRITESDSIAFHHYISEGGRYKSINSDSSLYYISKAINLSLKTESTVFISIAMQRLGHYYMGREMYEQALSAFLISLQIEQKRGDTNRIADLYDNLGLVEYYMEIFERSADYLSKALETYRHQNDTSGIAGVLCHLGMLHSSREFCEARTTAEKLVDFTTAIDYLRKASEFYEAVHDREGVAIANLNIASVYNKLEKPETALYYITESLSYYRGSGDPEGIMNSLFILGKTYYRLKDYRRSIESFRESEKIAEAGNLKAGMQYLYEAMAMPYYDTGDYKNAYDSYIKYMTIRDSVYNTEKSKQIIELETRYQSQVQENEILRLTVEKRRRNNLVYLLTAVIVMMASAAYYFVRLQRQGRIIAAQNLLIKEEKIAELEKERQYLATRSVMEGEEAERSRLAGDLHNGLGGLLSGIKINLSSLRENGAVKHDNAGAFNHAISLLDTSVSELRRIAHNLMPETLHHYGLKTALEDFCTQVSPAEKPLITLQFFGEDIRYPRETELTMYRIIQELVNNALKHAAASLINVQLFSEEKRLYAQVTDDGKGIETAAEGRDKTGKGFVNIRNRLTMINGRLDVWSSPGQGSEISVEILIP